MTGKPSSNRTFHLLAMAAAIVLTGGSLTLALEADTSAEEVTPQSAKEQGRGGCRCRNQAADAGEPGAFRRGKNSRQGGCGMQQGQGRGQGGGHGTGRGMGAGRGRSGGRRGHNQDVMQASRALVHDYRQDIVREIEDIENGVVTVTRATDNPEAVEVIKQHVREMKGLIEGGGRIRAWDPLFSEIFDHYAEVEMVVETLDDGVRVTETSANPEVVKLIQAHARKVNEFVARGPAAVHESTPLPDDYRGSD